MVLTSSLTVIILFVIEELVFSLPLISVIVAVISNVPLSGFFKIVNLFPLIVAISLAMLLANLNSTLSVLLTGAIS